MGNWPVGEVTIFPEKFRSLNIHKKCLKSISNVLKYLPDAKLLNVAKNFAMIQSLRFWIITLAHANFLIKIIFWHKFLIC